MNKTNFEILTNKEVEIMCKYKNLKGFKESDIRFIEKLVLSKVSTKLDKQPEDSPQKNLNSIVRFAKMEEKEWLKLLKEGDKVAVHGKFGSKGIEVIEGFTPTMIKTKSSRYWKKDGHEVGSDMWGGKIIKKLTNDFVKDLKLRVKAKELSELINRTSIINLGIERIEQIISLISKPHDSASQSFEESLINVKREPLKEKEEANFS